MHNGGNCTKLYGLEAYFYYRTLKRFITRERERERRQQAVDFELQALRNFDLIGRGWSAASLPRLCQVILCFASKDFLLLRSTSTYLIFTFKLSGAEASTPYP